jgi:hypothetical protein
MAEVSAEDAQTEANTGKPTIAIMGPKDISDMLPWLFPYAATVDGVQYPTNSQAGRVNFTGQSAYEGFKNLIQSTNQPIRYFVNDGTYILTDADQAAAINQSTPEQVQPISVQAESYGTVLFGGSYRELPHVNQQITPTQIILHYDEGTARWKEHITDCQK